MQWQNIFEFLVENGQGAIEKITQNWQAKTVLGVVGAWLVSICDLIDTPCVIFLALVSIDFITKMMVLGHIEAKNKNLKMNHLEAIWYGYHNREASKSLQMRTKGVNKVLQYMIILLVIFLFGKLIPPVFSEYSTFALDWVLFYLSVGEIKSIFENLQDAGIEEAAFFVKLFGDKKKKLEDKISGK